MVSKRVIVNNLFYSTLIFFGIGQYVSGNLIMPLGEILTVFPHILLILFYALDSLYKKSIPVKINFKFYIFVAFLLSTIASYWVGKSMGVPGIDNVRLITVSMSICLPFFGYLIWNFYNEGHEDFDPLKQILIAFNLYFVINLVGLGLGIKTLAHGFEGRITFPFSGGIYDGGNMLALLSILIFPNLIKLRGAFLQRIKHYAYFAIIVMLLMVINSRLTTLNLILIAGLFATRLAYIWRPVFIGAWFTLPFLLSSSRLVYDILSLPLFSVIMKRVNLEDVTTYNSRTYIWEPGLEWIMSVKEGFFTGMGYRGHATLELYYDIVDQWQIDIYALHSHSGLLDITIAQGILGILILAASFYFALQYYRRAAARKHSDRALFPIVMYMLFLLQFDSFMNPSGIGFAVFSLCMSRVAISKRKVQMGKQQRNQPTEEEEVTTQPQPNPVGNVN